MNEARAKSFSNSAVQKRTTAWFKFEQVLQKLRLPRESIISQPRDPLSWEEDRVELHLHLLHLYVAHVTETQERADTSVTYARDLNRAWLKQYNVTLWTESMFTDLKPVIKGLARIKNFHKRTKHGISATDLSILLATLQEWGRSGRRISPRSREAWDERLVANVAGALVFCHGNMFRFGDSTTPDGEDFDPLERLTRSSVRLSGTTHGHARSISVKPPKYKVANRHTGHTLVGTFAADPTNWASAVDHLLAVDHVNPRDGGDDTPLFRDTRGVRVNGKLRDGSFMASSVPLAGRFVRGIIHELIEANKDWFGDRLPEHFGTHSLRIGAMNDALAAGASYFEISALGRWVSQSVLDYHRMPIHKASEWHTKAVDAAVERALGNLPAHLADRLSSAMAAAPFRKRTARIAGPRPPARAGPRPMRPAQSTIHSWFHPRG